jgi:hypothetical protein
MGECVPAEEIVGVTFLAPLIAVADSHPLSQSPISMRRELLDQGEQR